VRHLGLESLITPFPTTSSIAAKLFKKNNITFDMVYLDASHDTDDVMHDIFDYLPLTDCLFGDDYDWPSVRAAVDVFPKVFQQKYPASPIGYNLTLDIHNEKWILRKGVTLR
jgi:hypothetical protein